MLQEVSCNARPRTRRRYVKRSGGRAWLPGVSPSRRGPAIVGSPDVLVNKMPALRVGDKGVHAACCNGNYWEAQAGSATVFINSKKAHRMGDADKHCGGTGSLIGRLAQRHHRRLGLREPTPGELPQRAGATRAPLL